MFESAELGHTIDKATYAAAEPPLRADLLDAQFDVAEAKQFAVIILVSGVEGAGKGETVNLLSKWMDPRHLIVHGMGAPSDEERERPPMWRFWRALPAQGRIGVFFGSWYSDPIVGRVQGDYDAAALEQHLQTIVHFERMLMAEGVLLVKFWFHLSKKRQKKRLKALEKDPNTRWRVTKADWKRFKHYDEFRAVSERVLRTTSTAEAPWFVIEGTDECYRSLMVGRILLNALQQRLQQLSYTEKRILAPPLVAPIDQRNILNTLDLSQSLQKSDYKDALEHYQGRLNLLVRQLSERQRALVAVFEGWDAAGKGGSIRRVTGALDARWYRVISVGAPSEEEQAQPYLWRFWRHIPRWGRVTLFDRSWYGRVLVERVEHFCPEAAWMRAYGEIREFEQQLVQHRVVLAKFWLHISKDEQLTRFQERETVRFKRFKITEEDWRNRAKWDEYEQAVCDMIDRTHTDRAPWTLVEANNKYYARIKVLQTLCQTLEAIFD